ncbi:MAG: Rhodanese domain protein [Firmicutes bacterium]|nr:Rhodanese domain protein [Bacillota bacterium]
MKDFRKSIVMLLILLFVLSVTGCSSNNNDSSKNQPEQKAPVADKAKDTLFVSADWVKTNLDQTIVIDARTDKEYNAGHIPGAINAPWQYFANMNGKPGDTDWGTLLPQAELASKIGALGINGEKTVVTYAAPPGWGEDGRVAWTLKSAGISKVMMLEGGWKAWENAGGEASKETPAPKAVSFKISAMDSSLNATTDWIKENSQNIKIVDSRSKKEYDGATDYGEARGGHIPQAINIPFENMFNKDGSLKSSAELTKMFTDAGLKPGDQIVTYCTKGIRSGYMALVLRMTGFENARNYDASFYNWAGDKSLTVDK